MCFAWTIFRSCWCFKVFFGGNHFQHSVCQFLYIQMFAILLMPEIPFPTTWDGMVLKPCLNNGISTTNQPYQLVSWSRISKPSTVLLMEEILHHLGCITPCKSWDKLSTSWCRISSINSITSSRSPARKNTGRGPPEKGEEVNEVKKTKVWNAGGVDWDFMKPH